MKGCICFSKLKKLNHNGKTYKNYALTFCNTFKVGGKAKYFLKICTLENFLKVMFYLQDLQVVPFILGNGSNILIADTGYDGVVIAFEGDFGRITVGDTLIECGAGVRLGVAFATAKDLGLAGLEDSAGIPATIGGATYMNAGAYDFEMSKVVEYVVAYLDGKIVFFDNKSCEFAYRHSVFQENNAIILRVGLRLKKSNIQDVQNRYLQVLDKRKETQPLDYPSAGCVFKRIDGVAVSKMLDEDGFKGRCVGGAMVSLKHANFIINKNNATSNDILKLINLIKDDFFKLHNIQLECEIKLLGEFDEIKR